MQKDLPLLTLSVAASLLNLHPRTLMSYEKEGLIKPHRTASNRRLFSQSDLSLVQFVYYLVDDLNVNMTGARIILGLLEKAAVKYPNLKKEFFPNFQAKDLI